MIQLAHPWLVILALAVCVGCSGGAEDPVVDTGTTAADTSPGATDSDGETDADDAVQCCPIAQFPDCSCFATGGSPNAFGACRGGLCDAVPVDWVLGEDEAGCAVWTCPAGGRCNDSCLLP